MSRLYLIPTPLGENCPPEEVLPKSTLEVIPSLHTFVVEELRSARRFLSAAGLRGKIDSLELHTLNEHSTDEEVRSLLPLFETGDVGLLSEAGLPAVADPGAALVALCQQKGIEVVPLTGPSSLMLALMASGLNGQSFAFCGYVSAKTEERRSELKNLEKISLSKKQTQIIIETPYRNDSLFKDMLSVLSDTTGLCIAADVTLPSQTILTRRIGQWKKAGDFKIGKRPCVFLILGQNVPG